MTGQSESGAGVVVGGRRHRCLTRQKREAEMVRQCTGIDRWTVRMKTQMDRKGVVIEIVRCKRDSTLRWGGGMTRQRREIEVVRWKDRQGSQTGWKDKCVVRWGGRDSQMEEEAKISGSG